MQCNNKDVATLQNDKCTAICPKIDMRINKDEKTISSVDQVKKVIRLLQFIRLNRVQTQIEHYLHIFQRAWLNDKPSY